MAHRLVMTAHHAEGRHRLAVPHQHAGDDGVHRALARADRVRVARIDAEGQAAIVQQHPALRGGDAAAEALEDRVDQRQRVAVPVDHAEIDRVLVDVLRVGELRPDHRLLGAAHVDGAVRARPPGLGEQVLHRHPVQDRIGEERVAVVVGLLAGLGEEVDPVELGQAGDVVMRQHVEHHQHREALSARRAFVDVVAAVARRHRRDDLGRGGGEVVEGVQPAKVPQTGHDVLRDRPLVEAARAVLRDALERGGELRMAHDGADAGRPPVDQVGRRRGRVAGDALDAARPVEGDPGLDRVAVLGVADRRLQQLAEAAGAVVVQELRPGGDRTRHRDGVGRGRREGDAALEVPGIVRRRRAAARTVQRDRRTRALRRVEGEAVAADAGHQRVDHALHRHRGDAGIDRVAAGAQDLDGREGRERMGRRDGGVGGVDGRAPGRREIPHRTVPSWFVSRFAPTGPPPGRELDRDGPPSGRRGPRAEPFRPRTTR